jgi:hypothetical protein
MRFRNGNAYVSHITPLGGLYLHHFGRLQMGYQGSRVLVFHTNNRELEEVTILPSGPL